MNIPKDDLNRKDARLGGCISIHYSVSIAKTLLAARGIKSNEKLLPTVKCLR